MKFPTLGLRFFSFYQWFYMFIGKPLDGLKSFNIGIPFLKFPIPPPFGIAWDKVRDEYREGMDFERMLKYDLPPFTDDEWFEEVRKMEGIDPTDLNGDKLRERLQKAREKKEKTALKEKKRAGKKAAARVQAQKQRAAAAKTGGGRETPNLSNKPKAPKQQVQVLEVQGNLSNKPEAPKQQVQVLLLVLLDN